MFFVMSIAGKTCFFWVYILRLYLSHILRSLMAKLQQFPSNRPPKSRDLGPAMPWSGRRRCRKPHRKTRKRRAASGSMDSMVRPKRTSQNSETNRFSVADLPPFFLTRSLSVAKFSGTHHSRELEWETVSVIVCMQSYWNFHMMIGTKIKGTWDLRKISSGALQEPFGTVQRLPPTVNFPRQDSG